MDEYIRREDAIKALHKGSDGSKIGGQAKLTVYAASCRLNNVPSVSVAPVVHCIDCKWFSANKKYPIHYGACECPGTPYGLHPTPEFFCACGEPVNKPVESVDNLGGINNDRN